MPTQGGQSQRAATAQRVLLLLIFVFGLTGLSACGASSASSAHTVSPGSAADAPEAAGEAPTPGDDSGSAQGGSCPAPECPEGTEEPP